MKDVGKNGLLLGEKTVWVMTKYERREERKSVSSEREIMLLSE